MEKQVDVLVIGAGTAGLSAIKEIRRRTENFLLVDKGPIGTTCARVGCMPSKALIQIAQDAHRAHLLAERGLIDQNPRVNAAAAFSRARELRDHFVKGMEQQILGLGERFIKGEARFVGPDRVVINGNLHVKAKRIIISAGSKPIVPEDWPQDDPLILTTDRFFEVETIPKRWAVVGMGSIGLELGQALAFLGLQVFAFDQKTMVGGLRDEAVNEAATRALAKDMHISLGHAVHVKKLDKGFLISDAQGSHRVDAVLAAMGRQPHFADMDIEKTGCELDKDGIPIFDSWTQSVKGAPLFLAGDVDKLLPILHEASDDGKIAGYNSVHDTPRTFKRKVRLGISFSSPGIAVVGARGDTVGNAIVGKASYDDQGRAKIMDECAGLIHLYVDQNSARLLGAEIVAPAAEHLAHLIAWCIQSELSILEMLRLPYYHPTLEEGLRTALWNAAKQLPNPMRDPELLFCDASNVVHE